MFVVMVASCQSFRLLLDFRAKNENGCERTDKLIEQAKLQRTENQRAKQQTAAALDQNPNL
jgi:hypothetical protein